MSRRLIAFVHVGGKAYGPGDEVPAAVARRIGAHAWADSADAEDVDDDQREGGGSEHTAPPRSGRGSGIEAWQAFAAHHDVEVAEGANRDDVIAACEAAGVVEPEQPKE